MRPKVVPLTNDFIASTKALCKVELIKSSKEAS